MEENKEIVQDENRSTDPEELRKNKLIELNTEENHQISKSKINFSFFSYKRNLGKD